MSEEIREYLKKLRELHGKGRLHYKQEEKFDIYGQLVFLFYAAIIGLLAGSWGNLWATAYWEYVVKGDILMRGHFLWTTIILVCLLATFFGAMIYAGHVRQKMRIRS